MPAVIEGYLPHLAQLRERVKSGRLPGIATGLPTVDKQTGGLQAGLHLLAASPGAGKTTLALQLSRQAAKAGAAVTYLALDEGGDRLAVKLAAGMSGLSATKYLRGEADPTELSQALEAHRDVLSRIEIYSGPAIAAADAQAMLQARMEMTGAAEGLLIVDFLQSWAGRMAQGSDFRTAVTHLTGQLREIALALKVPVLAIAAQNRQGQGEASMSSLRESSDLEYVSDSIYFLTEESDGSDKKGGDKKGISAQLRASASSVRRRVTLSCLKNRWGALFDTDLVFDAEFGRFGEQAR